MSTILSGPELKKTAEAFCLRQCYRGAAVECGSRGPGQFELNELAGSKKAQLLQREGATCEFMFLSNPWYLKVLMGSLGSHQ